LVKAGSRQHLAHAVQGFFLNGGSRCYIVNVGKNGALEGGAGKRQGIDLLEEKDEVAIVATPGFYDPSSHKSLVAHCERLKDRVAILDPGKDIQDSTDVEMLKEIETAASGSGKAAANKKQGLYPGESKDGYAALYAPWITVRNLFQSDSEQDDYRINVPPCGHLAGIYARTDATRGVHKAPANETIRGALNVGYCFTDAEQGPLNSSGVNCIRLFSREGVSVWGARTLAAASSEWRYLNVRRLFNMIEESIAISTRWVVFEPNDMSLWKSIRRDISAFLRNLWREGALMGATPEEAFFVKCDAETNPPEIINEGRVVTVIGISPVKPAEFVIFQISQTSGGAEID
jgi:phage tail sheath protein FI